METSPPGRRTIYVLSDSTGNLPRHMLTAFLTQFPANAFKVEHRPFLHTAAQVQRTLEACETASCIMLHALVAQASKRAVEEFCTRESVPQCDLTGPFVHFLARSSGLQSCENVKKLHEVDDNYERRIKALDFTLEHDDGLGLDTLHEADVVLAGVSRTSKTPTSIYLSQHGLKVANVSLAMAVQPPKQLFAIPKEKVIGLTIDPHHLSRIRTHRNAEWNMGGTSYNELSNVEEEILWCRRLFRQQGWTIIDVTNQAIEETAARIAAMRGAPGR